MIIVRVIVGAPIAILVQLTRAHVAVLHVNQHVILSFPAYHGQTLMGQCTVKNLVF